MRNRFHALCPYFAMFPESFVETWVDRLSRRGDTILDPFCGRGTTPFQSLLMERRAIGCDVNPVAYCVTRAKTSAPSIASVRRRLTYFENRYDPQDWERDRRRLPLFFRRAYQPQTLRQVLFLRAMLKWQASEVDCMIAALVLGSLHGESNVSQMYLSNQMPHTISTKPAYSVRFWEKHGYTAPKRDAFELLRRMADFRYASEPVEGDCQLYHEDMRNLPRLLSGQRNRIKCAITSPPYFDVTNFEEDQWLRLWFLGGPSTPAIGRVSRDDRHGDANRYWSFISDMWRMLGVVLAKKADVVVRIGASRIPTDRMITMMECCAQFANRKYELVSVEASSLRKRQTNAFTPGTTGCKEELDLHFALR